FYKEEIDYFADSLLAPVITSKSWPSDSSEDTFAIQNKNGTASVSQTKNGTRMSRRSLDDIVNEHPSMANANVLKIDTDGHDFEVITGAKRLLSQNLPVVLFECQPFENNNYVEDCLSTLKYFNEIGYNYFLLYNNFGNLMGRYSLSDLSAFKNLLFFQLTTTLYGFDILIMKDEDVFQFYKEEIDYFADKIPNKSLRRTAILAAEL
ncbi:FkbM family methyltransferase, partial [Thermodesulfobacteriota bacterium]